MTTIEALRVFSTEHDQCRDILECGLIAPEKMAEHITASLEESDLQAFDRLSELANGGLVLFRGRYLRIDDRIENENIIRSIIEPLHEDEAGNIWAQSSSHIAHRDGNNYFETHLCMITPDGHIHEPEIGSETIQTGTYQDIILHGLVANEVTTLPHAA